MQRLYCFICQEIMKEGRGGFTGTFGAIAVSVGSAVGLGNVWKFPYELGENGGAGLLLIYIICVLLIGLPFMLSELIVGRRTRLSAVSSFKSLTNKGSKWYLVGVTGVLAAFLILSFYSVIAGWTLHYLYLSIINSFQVIDSESVCNIYDGFVAGYFMPVFWAFLFVVVTAFVVIAGVGKGIERWSKFLMPVLFVLLVGMCIRSLTLPNSSLGLHFLFDVKIEDITIHTVLSALGQSAFSLSLGMCCMLTYSSYMKRSDNLVKTSLWIISLDTMVALLSAIMIFPAVFSFGIEPSAGPSLVFKTLPIVFGSMPYGAFFSTLFFLLLSIAALTSTMSLLEIIVAYVIDEWHFTRKKSVIIVSSIIIIFGSMCSLSLSGISWLSFFGVELFNIFDNVTTNYLLPIGGVGILLFVGWRMKISDVRDELSSGGVYKLVAFNLFIWSVRVVVPSVIVLVYIFN